MKKIKIGDKIYVDSSYSISHGSDDVVGGLATISKIENVTGYNRNYLYIEVKEHPGHSYNWNDLSERQIELKKEFGKNYAYKDPDIDTPWIEDGDIVNGKVYHGKDIF